MTAPVSPRSITVLPADHESDFDFSLTCEFGITHTLVHEYLTSGNPELLFDLLNMVPYDKPDDIAKLKSSGFFAWAFLQLEPLTLNEPDRSEYRPLHEKLAKAGLFDRSFKVWTAPDGTEIDKMALLLVSKPFREMKVPPQIVSFKLLRTVIETYRRNPTDSVIQRAELILSGMEIGLWSEHKLRLEEWGSPEIMTFDTLSRLMREIDTLENKFPSSIFYYDGAPSSFYLDRLRDVLVEKYIQYAGPVEYTFPLSYPNIDGRRSNTPVYSLPLSAYDQLLNYFGNYIVRRVNAITVTNEREISKLEIRLNYQIFSIPCVVYDVILESDHGFRFEPITLPRKLFDLSVNNLVLSLTITSHKRNFSIHTPPNSNVSIDESFTKIFFVSNHHIQVTMDPLPCQHHQPCTCLSVFEDEYHRRIRAWNTQVTWAEDHQIANIPLLIEPQPPPPDDSDDEGVGGM